MNDPVIGILERKKAGIDCTEEESAEIKGWLREIHIGQQQLQTEIESLFPQEWDEVLAEWEGIEGQDRTSYTDDQDRENYTPSI